MPAREEIENTLNRFMNSFDLKDWALMVDLLEPTIHIDYSDLRGGPPNRNRCRGVYEGTC